MNNLTLFGFSLKTLTLEPIQLFSPEASLHKTLDRAIQESNMHSFASILKENQTLWHCKDVLFVGSRNRSIISKCCFSEILLKDESNISQAGLV